MTAIPLADALAHMGILGMQSESVAAMLDCSELASDHYRWASRMWDATTSTLKTALPYTAAALGP
jgi:hypothetical protein